MTLGEKIKKYRLEKGMTQGELANAVGSTTAAISRYELNQREARYSLLQAIASVLDAPEDEFLADYPKDPLKINEYKERLTAIENELRSIEQKRNPSEQIKTIRYAHSLFSQLLNEERLSIKSIEEKQAEGTELIETRKDSRQGRLLTAFNQLNIDAQNKAIERVEELGLIPAYQQISLPESLKKYIYDKFKMAYEVISDAETQVSYEENNPFNHRDWLLNSRHMVLQRISGKEKRYWDFLYYSCPETLDSDSVIRQILCGQDTSKEPGDNISFIFDDEATLDRFYACYEEQKEFQQLNVCEPTTLFILVEKGSWTIKEVREYDPHN